MKQFLLILMLAGVAIAADSHTVSTNTLSAIRSACSAASAKDTVRIPFAKYMMNDSVYINKSLIIIGTDSAGHRPYMIDSCATGFLRAPFIFDVTVNDTVRISNLEFTCMTKHTDGVVTVRRSKAFRIDHCKFTDSTNGSRCIEGYLGAEGVCDNDSFVLSSENSVQAITPLGNDSISWLTNVIGTGNNFFIEDCVALFSYDNDGFLDCQSGGNTVVRHCIVSGSSVANHGFESGGATKRGVPSMEVYNNTFLSPNEKIVTPLGFRSGSQVVFNNTVSGTFQNWCVLYNYRSKPEFEGTHTGGIGTVLYDTINQFTGSNISRLSYVYKISSNEIDTVISYTTTSVTGKGRITWNKGDKYAITFYSQPFCGLCLGYSPCDGNEPGQEGYPCRDQIGRGAGQILEGTYAWNNVYNGDNTPSFTIGYTTREKTHIKLGRDVFENTRKTNYIPYTYPHPLTLLGTTPEIIIDHSCTNVAAIPDSIIDSAAALKSVTRISSILLEGLYRSTVGGLDLLEADNARYDRTNHINSNIAHPGAEEVCDDLPFDDVSSTVDGGFIDHHLSAYQIFITYVDFDEPWDDDTTVFSRYRDAMLYCEAAYSKKIVWTTMPCPAHYPGGAAYKTYFKDKNDFNDSVRNYCQTNGKILYDIADVLCHDTNGIKRVAIDGTDTFELMIQYFTTDSIHPNTTVSRKQLAKSFWWMISRIAGWPGLNGDATAPTDIGTVNDGVSTDVDSIYTITDISANWTASTDDESGVSKYYYCIGTSSGDSDIVTWTDNGSNLSATKTGLSLVYETTYYVSVKALNGVGLYSGVTTSDGQMVAVDLNDETAPSNIATANDGTATDIDTVNSVSILSANWTSSADDESGISGYWYSIGTSAKDSSILNWTNNGNDTTATVTGLELVLDDVYYINVHARNGAGLTSDTITTDGQRVRQPDSSLVLYFDFDDTTEGPSNAVYDQSGNEFDGQAMGALQTATFRCATGLHSFGFDGNDYISTVNRAQLTPWYQMSVSCWYKIADTAQTYPGVSKDSAFLIGATGPSNGSTYASIYTGGKLHQISGNPSTLNSWNMLTLTYDADSIRLYVNGERVAVDSATGFVYESIYDVDIGRHGADYMNGYIDDIRLYSYPLSEVIIDSLYSKKYRAGSRCYVSQKE